MIGSLTVDIASLQLLPEKEPAGLTLIEGGLCRNTCGPLATFNVCLPNTTCVVLGTCEHTQRSTAQDEDDE